MSGNDQRYYIAAGGIENKPSAVPINKNPKLLIHWEG